MSQDEPDTLYNRHLGGGGPARPNLDELEFVCAFELYSVADSQVRAVYLHRSAEADEGWSVDLDWEFDPGDRLFGEAVLERVRAVRAKLTCDVALRAEGSHRAALLRVLEWEISHPGFGCGAEAFVVEGLVSRRDYTRLRRKHEGQWRRKAAEVRSQRPPIVDTAEELGLYPRPTGGWGWVADCPGPGRHMLLLSSQTNEFSCPWCARRGGAEELREFVAHPTVGRGENGGEVAAPRTEA